MSMTVESPDSNRPRNTFIEWDTVRGRGDFDAGYINEFSLFMNENGEIDEQKKKLFDEDPQYKLNRDHKASSLSHKRSKPNVNIKKSTASEGQIMKKARKTRTVKLSAKKQSKPSQSKSESIIEDPK